MIWTNKSEQTKGINNEHNVSNYKQFSIQLPPKKHIKHESEIYYKDDTHL